MLYTAGTFVVGLASFGMTVRMLLQNLPAEVAAHCVRPMDHLYCLRFAHIYRSSELNALPAFATPNAHRGPLPLFCIGKSETTSDRQRAICTFIPPPSRGIRMQRCFRPGRPGAVHELASHSRTFVSLRSSYHCSSTRLYGRSGHGVSHDNAVRSVAVQPF